MCPLMCLVPLPLFNQFIMLSVGLYSIRSGPSTLLDKASCYMLVLAVVLILLSELKPLSHSAVVGEIVSIMRIRIIICFMCCTSAEFISPTRVSYASITARCKFLDMYILRFCHSSMIKSFSSWDKSGR